MGCVSDSESSSTITGQSTVQASDQIPNLPSSIQVLDVIGSGEFSEVRKCLDASNRLFALKCVPWVKIKKEVRVVCREVEILRKITHSNIVQWIGCFKDIENFYIAMELCEGGNLRDLMEITGKISENRLKPIIKEVLEALKYLHSVGIAHRDIKPENILLTDSGTAKIADFGLSRCLKKRDMTVVGTPYYIAPEVLKGKYTCQCDMWSLGVVVYVALTGRRPFEGSCMEELFSVIRTAVIRDWSGLSPEANDFLRHVLVKAVGERWTAAQALQHTWVCS